MRRKTQKGEKEKKIEGVRIIEEDRWKITGRAGCVRVRKLKWKTENLMLAKRKVRCRAWGRGGKEKSQMPFLNIDKRGRNLHSIIGRSE